MMKTAKYKRCPVLLFLFLLIAGAIPSFSEESPEPITGILGAIPAEMTILKDKMLKKEKTMLLGIEFLVGEIEGRKVVIALTGVGKVNAAMVTTLLLDHFRPTEVIFTGIAGGINPDLMMGDIVIAEKLAQHDFGNITSKGFQKGLTRNPVDGKFNPIFISSDPALVALAQEAACKTKFDAFRLGSEDRKPKVTKGIVATGDVFVASTEKKLFLAKEFGADIVEMEGAAIGQVCFQQKVPFIVLRSLSDNANERAGFDLQQFYKTAAINSATLTMALLRELTDSNRDQALKEPENSDYKHMNADK